MSCSRKASVCMLVVYFLLIFFFFLEVILKILFFFFFWNGYFNFKDLFTCLVLHLYLIVLFEKYCTFLYRKWHHILLDILAWGQRESSSLHWSLSGMGRAVRRICRRLLQIWGRPSGNRWLMLVLSTSPATPSHTMTRYLIPQQCLVLFPQDMVGMEGKLGLISTSLWQEGMPLCQLWKWPSGLTPTSKLSTSLCLVFNFLVFMFLMIHCCLPHIYVTCCSHFIVPELGPDMKFSYASHKAVTEYKEAKAVGD